MRYEICLQAMEKAEINRIGSFFSDVYEGICDGDDHTTMQLQLTELYRIIRILMDKTFETKDQHSGSGICQPGIAALFLFSINVFSNPM